ncbi:MAG: DUF1576 domain-containing protein [Clostridiales bacterium]|nr:DUF1576 domain-containing protein [Clostridiales bacterium]
MKHKKEKVQHHIVSLSRNKQFIILSLFPAYFLFLGLLIQPFRKLLAGFGKIITEPDLLITDYVALGGPGAALVNAGLLTLVCILIIYLLKMEITGATVTSVFLMMGFSLFGKNIVNIWAILAGVYLYSVYHKEHMSKYIYIGFYGTSLSPVITQIVLSSRLPAFWNIAAGILICMIMGFVLPPLATHLYYTHKGYCLYNVGFAAGIIAAIATSLFKSYGIGFVTRTLWSSGNNTLFTELLLGFFLILIILGFITEHHIMEKYLDILKHPGIAGTDYIVEEGLGATLFNMGINGILATVFVIAVGADLNGPTIGGIFTIVGFSATGKHIRNIAPVIAGVWLASLTKMWDITDPGAILAALFSTTLAPIAGKFGIVCGLIAGFLHSSVAQSVGVICGGMNLYNNGFAGGIVAAFLVPVIHSIESRRARAREII